jgi:hypothetical protein
VPNEDQVGVLKTSSHLVQQPGLTDARFSSHQSDRHLTGASPPGGVE